MSENHNPIPVPTLRRLPMYLEIVKELKESGETAVSSTAIAKICGLESILVRKDIASTGIVGQARCGFEINQLIDSIETFLGWRKTNEAFLVGAGSLGTALLKYKKFDEHSLCIHAAFDIDPAKIGKKIAGIPVFALKKLPDLIKRMRAEIGIITVIPSEAQSVADIMVNAGIRALWNFAPVVLTVPEGVVVENVSLSASLGVLTSKYYRKGENNG